MFARDRRSRSVKRACKKMQHPQMEDPMRKRFAASSLLACTGFALAGMPAHAASPIPIEFARGSYGAIAQGQVTANEPQQTFRLDVDAGQIMVIAFAGAGTMRGSVQCQGGVADGPFNGSGNSITIKKSGECDISVGANTMAEQWTGGFTLAVLVYKPPKP